MLSVRLTQAIVPAALLSGEYPGAEELRIAIEGIVRDGTIEVFLHGDEAPYWAQRLQRSAGPRSRVKAVRPPLDSVEYAESEDVLPSETANFRLDQYPARNASDFAIEFYVGRGHPKRQVERVIPLEGQFGFGTANALQFIAQKAGALDLIQYTDLQAFIQQTRDFYRGVDAGAELLRKAQAVTEFVSGALGSDVAAIFGSGFPFYAFEPDGGLSVPPAPKSVREYFDDQVGYFARKTLGAAAYRRHVSRIFDADGLKRTVGVEVNRNDFAADLFKNGGREVPPVPSGRRSLSEWKQRNTFALDSDFWPCQLCATLQFPEFFPSQARIKQTNTECLDCNQTPLMLRNVMGAASDVDLMVVVDGSASAAVKLKAEVLRSKDYYLFDTDFARTFSGDGPIDIFLLERAEVRECFNRLATPQWSGAAVPATALWCPTTEIEARLDLSFAVSFSPLVVNDRELEACFRGARRNFAAGEPDDQIVDALRRGSRWMEQILSNDEIVERVRAQLAGWRS